MADVNLYLEEPKKVIGEYTDFFAGQLPTANDFNRWLAVLIAQGDYNTAWLDLVAQRAGISINELYEELSILSEIVVPGLGTMFSQRLTTLETNAGEFELQLAEIEKHSKKVLKSSSYPLQGAETTDRMRVLRMLADAQNGDTVIFDEFEIRTDYIVTIDKSIHIQGLGRPVYDDNEKTFITGTGTHLYNTSLLITANGVTIENIAVDAYGIFPNGLEASYVDMSGLRCNNSAFRGNSHGVLLQSYGAIVVDCVFENCIVADGVHGFISKTKGVQFINCTAFNCTTNGFGLISDNIENVAHLSNCIDNTLISCTAIMCVNGFNMYSRDKHVVEGSSLIKHENVKLIGCNTRKCTNAFVIGETGIASGYTALLSINGCELIACAEYESYTSSLTIGYSKHCKFDIMLGTAGKGQSVSSTLALNNIYNIDRVDHSRTNGIFVDSSNSATCSPEMRISPLNVLVIRNTATTTVNRVSDPFNALANTFRSMLLMLVIDDSFTTFGSSGGMLVTGGITGNGSWVMLYWTGTYWQELTHYKVV